MSLVYDFKSGGSALIPIADGSHTTDTMSAEYGRGNCFLIFYDTDGVTPITPSGGTVTFKAAAIDGQWLDAGVGGAITASDVGTAYTPPSFDSMVVKSQMTLAGITGATYVRAFHWRAA